MVIGLLTKVDDVVGPTATGSSAEAGADRYEDRGVDRAAMGGTSREMFVGSGKDDSVIEGGQLL
jgi:hypothetical protein